MGPLSNTCPVQEEAGGGGWGGTGEISDGIPNCGGQWENLERKEVRESVHIPALHEKTGPER